MKSMALAAAVLGLIVLSAAQISAAKFIGLGAAPAGSVQSRVTATSANGSVVAGIGGNERGGCSPCRAIRWTPQTGWMYVSPPADGFWWSFADGVSADGRIILGYNFVQEDEAQIWTPENEWESLGRLPGADRDSSAQAADASLDGTVIVGMGRNAFQQREAFRWTQETGMIGLGALPGDRESRAAAISADGSVIVGASSLDYPSLKEPDQQVFRWTEETGMVGLGDLPGGTSSSFAFDVSADGNVIVGLSDGESGFEAFRWTSQTGMVGLGDFPGGEFLSTASAVSADGSIVVGQGIGENGKAAFIWNETDGMQNLQQVLFTTLGLDLTGWTLEEAKDISADGTIIVGNGINPDGHPESWMVVIPEPSSGVLSLLGVLGLVVWVKTR